MRQLGAYGAGIQIHFEDLGDYTSGRERRENADERWEELRPAYEELAAQVN